VNFFVPGVGKEDLLEKQQLELDLTNRQNLERRIE
jgi:hypothetical protein